MNSKDHSQQGTGVTGPDTAKDEILESLFSHASVRKRAPEEDEMAVKEALHSEWLNITRRQSRRKFFSYGIAASFALAAVIGFNMLGQNAPGPDLQRIAEVDKQSGNIFVHQLNGQSSDSRRLASDGLFAGQVLSTAHNARLAFNMNTGETIRVNENTRLAFISERELELISGQIYLDSNQAGTQTSRRNTLMITTFAGAIRHLGTQYLATIEDSMLAVSVREGQVLVATENSESIASPGEQLSVTGEGETSIVSIATHGPVWEWTELVTPEFVLDGRSAFEFIRWVGRETGRMVNFAPDGAELLARSTELRGSIDLEPMRALNLILQTSDLEPIIENGNILIRKRTGT